MKTLIVFGSTYGYTAEAVKELSNQIEGEVVVINAMKDEVPSLERFDNIIIGGSIYMGHIQKKIKAFCIEHLNELKEKRIGLFLSCGVPDNFKHFLGAEFPQELIDKALVIECFGGELKPEKMKFMHRMITGIMKSATKKQGKSEPKPMSENIKNMAIVFNK
jgi:menaquinone-dependent protoporphyrinogen oxidase